MRPPVRQLLVFIVGWAAVSVLAFLFLADFFTAWNGTAVSVRSADPDQPRWEVLIVEPDGTNRELTWDRTALDGIDVGIDRRAIPPLTLRDELPETKKDRFSLTYTITPHLGSHDRTMATAGPQPFALALLLFLLGIPLRNMLVAGSPIALERVEGPTVPAQSPAGAPSEKAKKSTKRTRSKKGPPPGKPRRGNGRRG